MFLSIFLESYVQSHMIHIIPYTANFGGGKIGKVGES